MHVKPLYYYMENSYNPLSRNSSWKRAQYIIVKHKSIGLSIYVVTHYV